VPVRARPRRGARAPAGDAGRPQSGGPRPRHPARQRPPCAAHPPVALLHAAGGDRDGRDRDHHRGAAAPLRGQLRRRGRALRDPLRPAQGGHHRRPGAEPPADRAHRRGRQRGRRQPDHVRGLPRRRPAVGYRNGRSVQRVGGNVRLRDRLPHRPRHRHRAHPRAPRGDRRIRFLVLRLLRAGGIVGHRNGGGGARGHQHHHLEPAAASRLARLPARPARLATRCRRPLASLPEGTMNGSHDTQSMAVFCDFENVALGVEDARYDKFDIGLILEKLLLKGSIVVKKAYCDWERYKSFKAAMHQASFELIEIPHVRQSGKNSADIRLVVDALDLCYTKSHVDTFVIISGDSDFSPLVSKLRENAKTVIGVGVKNSTSDLLIANCDEFIYYDDLVRLQARPKGRAGKAGGKAASRTGDRSATAKPADKAEKAAEKSDKRSAKAARKAPATADQAAEEDAKAPVATEPAVAATADNGDEQRLQEAMDLLLDTYEALLSERGSEEKIWGSMIKQALKRRNPGFSESYYGFRSFNS